MAIAHQLVRLDQNNPKYQLTLASSHYGLGVAHYAAGRIEEAESNCQAALRIQRELDHTHHQVLDYPESLARTLNALGAIYRELGKSAQAVAVHQEALKLCEDLAKDQPRVAWYRFLGARVRQHLGIVRREIGRLEEAKTDCQQALEACTMVVREHPDHITFAMNLGFMKGTLADLLRDQGKPGEALTGYDRAIEPLQGVLQKEPRQVDAREYLCLAQVGRAVALAQLGKHTQAAKALPRPSEGGPGRLDREIRLSGILLEALAGDHAAAAAQADELARQTTALSGRMLFDLACAHALCVSAAHQDGKLPAAEREKRANQAGPRAVELLRAAQKADYFQTQAAIRRLADDANLASIRSRPDYQQLVREIKAKGEAAAK
jgi:tetratricopeptide (TPR) repeat protein